MITQTELKELFLYCPATGYFTRIGNIRGRAKLGDRVGVMTENGYISIIIKRRKYMAHRLAWLYINGELPKYEIDHINHNRSDNSINNLREVEKSENLKNKRLCKNNKTGQMGVYWRANRNCWIANIYVNSKLIYLGSSKFFDDVVKLRKEAEKKYGFHKNHGVKHG